MRNFLRKFTKRFFPNFLSASNSLPPRAREAERRMGQRHAGQARAALGPRVSLPVWEILWAPGSLAFTVTHTLSRDVHAYVLIFV